MPFLCPVCGYPDLSEVPVSPETGGSYEICPSCGFQFGVSDEDEGISIEQWRKRWIQAGMKWFSQGIPAPKKWNSTQQLANAGLLPKPGKGKPSQSGMG